MKAINTLSRAMNIVASAVLAAMIALTVADVALRYFLRRPILGTTELTENMMVALVFLGISWCAVQNAHLKVDLLVSLFSPRLQALIDSLTTLLGLVVVALFTWRSFVEALAVKELNIVSSLIKIPAYPFYFIITLGCALLALVMVAQLIEHVQKAVNR
jgi:TRAP-type C4-dicarboxylate transport system permease small subunit